MDKLEKFVGATNEKIPLLSQLSIIVYRKVVEKFCRCLLFVTIEYETNCSFVRFPMFFKLIFKINHTK